MRKKWNFILCFFLTTIMAGCGTKEKSLSEEELNYFNTIFFSSTRQEVHNQANQVFVSEFDSPENIDFISLFYNHIGYYTGDTLEITDDELEYLRSLGADTNLDISKNTKEYMEECLKKYFGLSIEETNKISLDLFYYNSGSDSYYLTVGDCNFLYVNVIEGTYQTENELELICEVSELPFENLTEKERDNLKKYRVRLRKEGVHYYFLKNEKYID